MSAPKYHVGQRVWITATYGRGAMEDREGTVTKVGRTLVHVQGPWGKPDAYRMATGYINDGFGHSRIRTDQDRVDEERREAVQQRWRDHRVTLEAGARRISTEVMEQIADLLDGAAS